MSKSDSIKFLDKFHLMIQAVCIILSSNLRHKRKYTLGYNTVTYSDITSTTVQQSELMHYSTNGRFQLKKHIFTELTF